MPNTPEERVIEKIRNLLIADATVINYTQQRVYASHISSIKEPKYPAVSIHLLFSKNVFSNPEYVEMTLQIDSWFPATKYDLADVMTLHRKIRDNIHRMNLTDTTIGVKVAQSIEILSGPLMHEEDTDLFHYPTQYQIVAT